MNDTFNGSLFSQKLFLIIINLTVITCILDLKLTVWNRHNKFGFLAWQNMEIQ